MDVYDVLGKGHFFYLGKVEDSATAEISRSQVGFQKLSNVHGTIYTNLRACIYQVWQWIRHQVRLEDNGTLVTRALVHSLAEDLMEDLKAAIRCQTSR